MSNISIIILLCISFFSPDISAFEQKGHQEKFNKQIIKHPQNQTDQFIERAHRRYSPIKTISDYVAPSVKQFLLNKDIDSHLLTNEIFKTSFNSPSTQYVEPIPIYLREMEQQTKQNWLFNTPLIYQIKEIKRNFFMILYSSHRPDVMLFEESCRRTTEWHLAVVSFNRHQKTFQQHASMGFTTPIKYLNNHWNMIYTNLILEKENLIRSDYSNFEWNTEYGKKAYDKDIAIEITFDNSSTNKTIPSSSKNRLNFNLTGQLNNWKFNKITQQYNESGNQNNLLMEKCVRRVAKSYSNNNHLEIEQATHRNKLLIYLTLSQRTSEIPVVELYQTYYQDGIWQEKIVAKIKLKSDTKTNQFKGVFYAKNNYFNHGSKIKAVYVGTPSIPPLSTWTQFTYH